MNTPELWIEVLNKYMKIEALPKLGMEKADFKGDKKLAGELSDEKS